MSASESDPGPAWRRRLGGVAGDAPDWLPPVAGALGFPVAAVVAHSTLAALDGSGTAAVGAAVVSGGAIVLGTVLAACLGWSMGAPDRRG